METIRSAVVLAHPDDEALFGIYIAQHPDTHVVLLTKGEAGVNRAASILGSRFCP